MSERRKRAEAIVSSIEADAPEPEAQPAAEAAAAAAEPAAEPEKELAPAKGPAEPAAPAAAAAPPAGASAEEVTDWKAKYESDKRIWDAREQELNRANEGILRDLRETRLRRKIAQEQAAAAQPQPGAQPGAPADSRIPIEWNEKGEAYVRPEVLARFVQPDTSWQEHVARIERENRNLRVISENPTVYAPMEAEIAGAFQTLDLMVRRKQSERDALGLFSPLGSPDEAVAFIEEHVASEWRTLYPDLAPDRTALRELLDYAANPRAGAAEMRKVFQSLATRRGAAKPGNGHAEPAAAAAAPTSPVPTDRPRSHAERGGKAPAPVSSTTEREMNELLSRDFLSLSPDERSRFRELRRKLDARDRERDAQGRFQ